MGTKHQRAVYEWMNISDELVYEWVLFIKGQVYDMIGVGFEILVRTPVPQLPPSYPRGSDCVDAQGDLGLRYSHMQVDTFSHSTAQMNS